MALSFQTLRDFCFFPLRCLFPNNEYIRFLKVTPLSDLRLKAVWPLLRGRVLDLGCGDNQLINTYKRMGGSGLGADLPSNRDCDVSVTPGQALLFPDCSFDTITIIAALNHIPDRERVLKECARCLSLDGRMVITMLGPLAGRIGHLIWGLLGSDADLKHRKPAPGERPGLSKTEIKRLLHQAGFPHIQYRSFAMGLNTLYLASKTRK